MHCRGCLILKRHISGNSLAKYMQKLIHCSIILVLKSVDFNVFWDWSNARMNQFHNYFGKKYYASSSGEFFLYETLLFREGNHTFLHTFKLVPSCICRNVSF